MMRRSVPILLLVAALVALSCDDENASPGEGDANPPDGSDGDVVFPDLLGDADAAEDSEPVVTCDDEDAYSPNHSAEDAADVELTGFGEEDLFVCSGFDDFYRIELPPGGGFRAQLEFANRLGNLDLRLFAEGHVEPEEAVATSATEDDLEEIRYVSAEGGTFVLEVDGRDDASGFYDLEIQAVCTIDADCPCGPQSGCETIQRCLLRGGVCDEVREPMCGQDAFEPNNQMSAPYPLFEGAEGFVSIDGAICADDVDYYRLGTPETSRIVVDLSFEPGNDLDLVVVDLEGSLVDYSLNEGDLAEHIDLPILGAGTYLVYVDTLAGGTSDIDYDLSIVIERDDACETDVDCNASAGREICRDGACVSFEPDEPSVLGESCDSTDDCDESAPYCLVGEPGFDDNFCTNLCEEAADCGGLEGWQCVIQFGRTGFCYPACETDTDCPTPYSCPDSETGLCRLVDCAVDDDCTAGQACLRTDSDLPYCRAYTETACAGLDADGNGRWSDATPVDLTTMPLTGRSICDVDDDWYTVEVAEEPARLDVRVTFQAGADLDVYIYDAFGRTVGQARSFDDNPETAVADLIPQGTYWIRVNQVPRDSPDVTTSYSLDVSVEAADGCTVDGGECLALEPLRIQCEESGACSFFEGDGAVTLGQLCDSSDDCTSDAQFCFTFLGAQSGDNICTRRCSSNADCSDVPETTCRSLNNRFAVCLPE